jgi:hypothetical protein
LWKNDKAAAMRWLASNGSWKVRSLVQGWDGGTAHQAARGKNGRVKGSYRVMVTNASQVKKYIKTRQRNVGILAASVPTAAGSKFGDLKGVPKWVSTKKSRYGYARGNKSGKKRSITLGLTNSAVNDMQRRFNDALGYRLKAMEREIPFVARSLEKKLRARLA